MIGPDDLPLLSIRQVRPPFVFGQHNAVERIEVEVLLRGYERPVRFQETECEKEGPAGLLLEHLHELPGRLAVRLVRVIIGRDGL